MTYGLDLGLFAGAAPVVRLIEPRSIDHAAWRALDGDRRIKLVEDRLVANDSRPLRAAL